MMKAVCAIGILAIMMISPVLAQGPFTDVPTDHWAYPAVDQLAKDGIIVGYPDGTFGGKRAMTRFEFAQALARAVPVIVDMAGSKVTQTSGVSQADLDKLAGRVSALEARPAPEVTKADLDRLQKLLDEFKDELAGFGVDIDALKRDVKELDKRVTALEDEVARVKIKGVANFVGIGERERTPTTVDLDERTLHGDTKLSENVSLFTDIDLWVTGRVGDKAKVVLDANFGNYLNGLEAVDDYAGGFDGDLRPVRSSDFIKGPDTVQPYYLYGEAALWNGAVTVGRFPLQWNPYILKLIDVDSYSSNPKTDSGDYPLDGIKGAWQFGGVGLQLFASKVDQNIFLRNGLTSQPTAGLYNENLGTIGGFSDVTITTLGAGHAMGGLETIDQAAGGRVSVGIGKKGSISGSYIEAASSDGLGFDKARLWGADLNWDIGAFALAAFWGKIDTLSNSVAADVNNENTALDASVAAQLGGLNVKGGWKSIDHNYTAPGFWDKIGRWTNPSNVEGPYADLKWGAGSNITVLASGEWLSGKRNVAGLPVVIDQKGDDVSSYKAGVKWGITSASSVDLGVEWVKWNPTALSLADATERYINIGFGYQFNPNMAARIGYQIVDFTADGVDHPYSATDYKGDIAVAQFSVKF